MYAFFTSERKMEIFKYNNFYEKNIDKIISNLENLINIKYPCSSTKMVFVPNLFTKDSKK